MEVNILGRVLRLPILSVSGNGWEISLIRDLTGANLSDYNLVHSQGLLLFRTYTVDSYNDTEFYYASVNGAIVEYALYGEGSTAYGYVRNIYTPANIFGLQVRINRDPLEAMANIGSAESGIVSRTPVTGERWEVADPSVLYSSYEEALVAIGGAVTYPITYSYTNSTVSGPAEAAVGDTVTVSAVPYTDYGITDPATQISVTNNDAHVNFTWDAATNTITFTMPDPT